MFALYITENEPTWNCGSELNCKSQKSLTVQWNGLVLALLEDTYDYT